MRPASRPRHRPHSPRQSATRRTISGQADSSRVRQLAVGQSRLGATAMRGAWHAMKEEVALGTSEVAVLLQAHGGPVPARITGPGSGAHPARVSVVFTVVVLSPAREGPHRRGSDAGRRTADRSSRESPEPADTSARSTSKTRYRLYGDGLESRVLPLGADGLKGCEATGRVEIEDGDRGCHEIADIQVLPIGSERQVDRIEAAVDTCDGSESAVGADREAADLAVLFGVLVGPGHAECGHVEPCAVRADRRALDQGPGVDGLAGNVRTFG